MGGLKRCVGLNGLLSIQQLCQTLVWCALPIRRQLVFGLQVMVGKHIQIGIEHPCGMWLTSQVQAQGPNLGGAKMVASAGSAQTIVRQLIRVKTEHRQVIEIRAFAKHLARFGPGAIQQYKQRSLWLLF